ncbi:MAG: heme a synthase [Hyphomicrobiales bacterium]|jgi:cytochrome c oxidase assembly protein subunit 15|nr:heme a synthase [Hyphomicrobiales bacterium]
MDPSEHRQRIIRLWLHAVAVLIFAMVLVGGATRLTESGLSIVEWKPVTGTLPPLSETAWQAEFDKYKTIPQFTQRNHTMTLSEFKTIFWWEWAHRLMGRLIGAAFLLPFLWFLVKGWIGPDLRWRLWTIFGLGALQGAVGWWMVASGLTERLEVSQYRLATHLILACVIFAAVLWTAGRLSGRARAEVPPRVRATAIALLVLVLVQIYLGALVAGLRAGLIYNTWPLIDGSFIPDAARLAHDTPLWRNVFENTLTVQFNHRMMAYALWPLALFHAFDIARTLRGGPALAHALALAAAVTIQAALGILTLIHQVPIGLALAHQGLAMIVLALAVIHAGWIAARQNTVPIRRSAAAR